MFTDFTFSFKHIIFMSFTQLWDMKTQTSEFGFKSHGETNTRPGLTVPETMASNVSYTEAVNCFLKVESFNQEFIFTLCQTLIE